MSHVTLESADTTNGNQFVATGREVIRAENRGTAAHTVTIESVADEYGRTQDIQQSLSSSARVQIGPMELHGYEQSDGNIYLSATNSTVGFEITKVQPV
jgi:hypothetical protein